MALLWHNVMVKKNLSTIAVPSRISFRINFTAHTKKNKEISTVYIKPLLHCNCVCNFQINLFVHHNMYAHIC